MDRIKLLSNEEASESAKTVLYDIAKGGKVINIFKAMANSPAVLKTFFAIAKALEEKTLDSKIAESIGIQIAYINGCEYCQAAHSYLAANELSQEEIALNREGKSSDKKTQVALDFAALVMKKVGKVSDEEFEAVRKAGFSDGEILEIVSIISLNFFTNAVNNVSQTRVDFPKPKG